MPLRKDEMKHIREEEIYRQEVRARLNKDKPSRTKKEKVWDYLNSPLALWFLSTIVVGIVTLAYTNHMSSVKKAEEQKESLQKIQAEIHNRLSTTFRMLEHLLDESKREVYHDPKWVYQKAQRLLDGNDPDLPFYHSVLYPEFKEKSWESLINDLARIREEVSGRVNLLSQIYHNLESLSYNTPSSSIQGKPTDEDRKRYLDAIDKAMIIIIEGL